MGRQESRTELSFGQQSVGPKERTKLSLYVLSLAWRRGQGDFQRKCSVNNDPTAETLNKFIEFVVKLRCLLEPFFA